MRITGSRVSFRRANWRVMNKTWETEVAPLALAALKAEAPVDTEGKKPGALRDSIKFEGVSGALGATMTFTSDVPYAKYVVKGTKGPYPIVPRPGGPGVLAWKRQGSWNYAMHVNHPGIEANNFPERALRRLEPVLRQRLSVAVREMVTPE